MNRDPLIVSIASGKGGVGKTMVAVNLAVVAARKGLRVVLADLDLGGADANLVLGQLSPARTLAHFIDRRVPALKDVLLQSEVDPHLRLIAGAGETLQTANPSYAVKKRIKRQLLALDADLVLVDVGAGTGFNALDFFLLGEQRVVVATPEPTSVVDAYKFVKLAAVRHVLREFLARDAISLTLAKQDFRTLDELRAAAALTSRDDEAAVQRALSCYAISLVVNNVTAQSRLSVIRLGAVIREFVGGRFRLLGTVPHDPAVPAALARLRPVAIAAPTSPAAQAIAGLFDRLFG